MSRPRCCQTQSEQPDLSQGIDTAHFLTAHKQAISAVHSAGAQFLSMGNEGTEKFHFAISSASTASPCTARIAANLGQPNFLATFMTRESYATWPILFLRSPAWNCQFLLGAAAISRCSSSSSGVDDRFGTTSKFGFKAAPGEVRHRRMKPRRNPAGTAAFPRALLNARKRSQMTCVSTFQQASDVFAALIRSAQGVR